MFVSVTEPVVSSLRCLDSGQPNLKDAAFAFDKLEIEYGEPLIGKLAAIKEWGEIDLMLDLRSEHLGNLASYVKSMMLKRKADWLSPLVLAGAAANPVYSYSAIPAERWPEAITRGDSGIRIIFSKWCWGDDDLLLAALAGWTRFRQGTGVYAQDQQGRLLARMVNDPVGFYSHVAGTSTLAADKAFAKLATYLCCGFASQSGAERTNKYMVEVQVRALLPPPTPRPTRPPLAPRSQPRSRPR